MSVFFTSEHTRQPQMSVRVSLQDAAKSTLLSPVIYILAVLVANSFKDRAQPGSYSKTCKRLAKDCPSPMLVQSPHMHGHIASNSKHY